MTEQEALQACIQWISQQRTFTGEVAFNYSEGRKFSNALGEFYEFDFANPNAIFYVSEDGLIQDTYGIFGQKDKIYRM